MSKESGLRTQHNGLEPRPGSRGLEPSDARSGVQHTNHDATVDCWGYLIK